MVPLLAVILFAAATLVDSDPANDISPCQCDGYPNMYETVVCSNITSEDQLRGILRARRFQLPLQHLVLQNLPFFTMPSLGNRFKVKAIEILDGNISHFSRYAFRNQPLSSLRVDRNRLADVPSVALSYVSQELKILSMSGNALTKLEHASLNFMSVEKLTLSDNEISEVARDSLPKYVQYLWISRNNLTTFNGSLQFLKDLNFLDASNNRLKSMKGEFDSFFRLRLQTVILDFNNISDISDSFSKLPFLKELSLVGNGIREVGEALNLKHLTHLNLSRNGITNLSRTVFENMKDLYDLNLSENPLTAFQICPTLKPLMSLRIVNLSNSNLESLSSDCFDNNMNLEFVDLSRNQLSTLGLVYATKLVTLDISFNNFRCLNTLDLPTNGSATLILDDNPWRFSKETASSLKDLDERGYDYHSGYPTCF